MKRKIKNKEKALRLAMAANMGISLLGGYISPNNVAYAEDSVIEKQTAAIEKIYNSGDVKRFGENYDDTYAKISGAEILTPNDDGYAIVVEGAYNAAATTYPSEDDWTTLIPQPGTMIPRVGINQGGGNTVKINGNIKAGDYSEININLDNPDSYIAGKLETGSAGGVPKITLEVSNGATWYVLGDEYTLPSSINAATIPIRLDISATTQEKAGILDIWHSAPAATARISPDGKWTGERIFTLKALDTNGPANYVENATFIISSDIQNGKADKIVLDKTGRSGSYYVKIAYDPAMKYNGVYEAPADKEIVILDSTGGSGSIASSVEVQPYTTTVEKDGGLIGEGITITPYATYTNDYEDDKNGKAILTGIVVTGSKDKAPESIADNITSKIDVIATAYDVENHYTGDIAIDVTDGDAIHAKGTKHTIVDSSSKAKAYINEAGTSTVKIKGDVSADDYSQINANLNNKDSYLIGDVKAGDNSKAVLNVKNQAVWSPSANEYTLSSGDSGISVDASGASQSTAGIVDIWHNVVRPAENPFRTFTVNNAGANFNNSTFMIASDIQNNKADKIVLNDTTGTNSYFVKIVNDPAMKYNGVYNAAGDGIEIFNSDKVTAQVYKTTVEKEAGLLDKEITITPIVSTADGKTNLTGIVVADSDDKPAEDVADDTTAIGVVAESNSITKNYTGNTTIKATGGNAVSAKGTSHNVSDTEKFTSTAIVNVNPDGKGTVKIEGDIYADDYSQINVNLNNKDSYLAGDLKTTGTASINLKLKNAATWYAPKDAYTLSTGTNGVKIDASGTSQNEAGVIDIWQSYGGMARVKNGGAAIGGRTFTVDNAGSSFNNATFVISSDINNKKADKVILNGTAGSNKYFLSVAADPSMEFNGTYTSADTDIVVMQAGKDDVVEAKAYNTTIDHNGGLLTSAVTIIPTVNSKDGVATLTGIAITGSTDKPLPPAENPPSENPPAENPPAENPPSENPPSENPPSENPPSENPPSENPPSENPPSENPPAENPPAENPPSENPPAENPPSENPPSENPPSENPPSENPPSENPPAVNPPSEGPAVRMQRAAQAGQMASFVATRIANNDIHKRLGDIRDNVADNGAWVRSYGGETDVCDTSLSAKYYGIQGGYDWTKPMNEGKLIYGLSYLYTHTNINDSAGNISGGGTGNLFGVYGSYVGEKGHYADAIIKVGRFASDFSNYSTASGTTYTGETSSTGLNMSLEYGYRQQLKNDLFFEPQVEFNYSHVGGDSYNLRNNGVIGAHVSSDAMDSFIGRAGFNFGKKNKNGNIYFTCSLLHEFAGSSSATMRYGATSYKVNESYKDTWLDYGVGFNLKAGEGQNVYGEISRTSFGSKMNDKWKVNVGYRLSF